MTDKQPRFITKGEIVTAGQAERIARSLGEHGKGLNRRRIDSPRRRGKLAATRTSDTGMVLAAQRPPLPRSGRRKAG